MVALMGSPSSFVTVTKSWAFSFAWSISSVGWTRSALGGRTDCATTPAVRSPEATLIRAKPSCSPTASSRPVAETVMTSGLSLS